MGLNISGLVLNKNCRDNVVELAHILGEEFLNETSVSFDEACESWKGDDYCDVYFSEKGTLVFLSMEKGGFEFCEDGLTTFSFVLSESTGMYCFNYTQNGQLIRSYFESDADPEEGDVVEDEGELLDIEKTEEDKSEVIFHLIKEVLGEDFHAIDLDANCKRYWFVEPHEETTDVFEEVATTKPWWKFW